MAAEGLRMQHVAPAGTPISPLDLLRWGGRALAGSGATLDLEAAFKQRFGVRHCFFVSSGRAAMGIVLKLLAELAGPGRDQVIVPAYTCYSVPAAAVKAGLRVRVCDIDPRTLSYDLDALRQQDFSRVLAIVSANLYGIPNDLPALEELARGAGVFLLDDAAQCLDGQVGERYAGTFGDIGLYSLDKGKNITSIQGGVLVTGSDAIAERLGATLAALPAPSRGQVAAESVKLLIYALLLHPQLYWIPQRLLKLGDTVYTTEWPVTRYSDTLAAMAKLLFDRLDDITAARIANAEHLRTALREQPGLEFPAAPQPGRSVFARLPVLVTPSARRQRLIDTLIHAGFGATASYPQSVLDVAALRPHIELEGSCAEGGRRVAAEVVTLPTHPYVTSRHLELMTRLTKHACQ